VAEGGFAGAGRAGEPRGALSTKDATRSGAGGTAIAVVAIAFLFQFVARGVADAFVAFILPLEAEFGWSRQSLTGVFATYMLMSGLGAPVAGWAFDRLGPRVVYTGGLALLAAGTWLAGQAVAPWQLYLTAGVTVGLGVAALGMVSAATLIARWHRRNLSTAIAIAYAGFGLGILVTLPIVQALIERYGWRTAWEMLGIGVAALLPLCLLLPWRRFADGPAGPLARASDPTDAARQRGPTLHDALRSPAYWRLVQAFVFTAVASYLVTPQTVAFLIETGFAPLTAASAYGTAGLLSTGGVIAAGWLAGRLGFGRTAWLTYGFTAVGVGALLLASYTPSTAALVCHVVFFGLAQGARGPIISTLSNRLFAGSSAGTIYGTIFCSMAIGGAIGSYAGGALHDLTGGYRTSFVLALLSILVAAEPFRAGSAILRDIDRPR
jgi:MFS family permease